ncbi:phospholipase D/transphosphatidylase [Neobacillus bataviensis LMG 21833]|uniref:Cardiolipin synthase n=1 Tax=Neobacillus bataviensis LMG 21833 TaxID=1117379 RepID=K6D9X1_9BACI|nr:cardiolipin synthase [Neobacillus bataviensis]EKN64888.1 phospholipase D/transphosphatidylase [Neobacillus bataviensis LMG 21833]
MKWVLILGGLVLLIIIWLVIDFRLGRKKHLSVADSKETPILHGEFEIFTHGKELFHDYFSTIRGAKRHIHVLFYIVKDDAISQEFFALLKEKAREGIEVRLLLDRLGSWKIKKQVVAALREAGIQFAFSNRIKLPFPFYSAQVRNHRKISIIDGEIGYLGGYNIGKEYIDGDPLLSPWRDYHVRITGESVNFLQSIFLIDWNEYAGEELMGRPVYFPKLPKGVVRHRFIATEAGQLEENFIRLIRNAEHSILIGTPYFIPSAAIFTELLAVRRRGVSVTVIVPFTADHLLVQEASFRYLRRLLAAGAAVYQYKKGFYHAKTIVIDDKVCDIGTANFDRRSLFLNKEINCYIYDPALIERVKAVIEKDILDSEPLSLAELNKPNIGRSMKEGIAAAVSNFL